MSGTRVGRGLTPARSEHIIPELNEESMPAVFLGFAGGERALRSTNAPARTVVLSCTRVAPWRTGCNVRAGCGVTRDTVELTERRAGVGVP